MEKGRWILQHDGGSHPDALLMMKDPDGSRRSLSSWHVPTGTTARHPRDGEADMKATLHRCGYLKRQQLHRHPAELGARWKRHRSRLPIHHLRVASAGSE